MKGQITLYSPCTRNLLKHGVISFSNLQAGIGENSPDETEN
jgi:hypothetical protein